MRVNPIFRAMLVCGALAYPASASGAEDNEAPGGIYLGGFSLYPSLEAQVGTDDNVYAQPAGEVSDTFYFLAPSLVLSSNWSRHELDFSVENTNVWHSEQGSEDHSDWTFGSEGRVDLTYATSFHGRAIYSLLTESRGDASAIALAAEPTEYERFEGFLELRHRFNQLGVAIGGGLTIFDYDDVPAVFGGTIDNDNRDHDVTLARAEVNYAVSPDTRMFVRGTFNNRQYDMVPPAVALNRDSDGYEVVGGLSFDVTNLIEGEIFAGYLEQDYDTLADIDGLAYGANFDWAVTQLTTVSVNVGRAVEETNQAATSGYLASTAGADVRHELTRTITLSAGLGFTNNDYEGSVREEDIWNARLGGEYAINRYLSATAGYNFATRESSLPLADYDRNRAWIGLLGHF